MTLTEEKRQKLIEWLEMMPWWEELFPKERKIRCIHCARDFFLTPEGKAVISKSALRRISIQEEGNISE